MQQNPQKLSAVWWQDWIDNATRVQKPTAASLVYCTEPNVVMWLWPDSVILFYYWNDIFTDKMFLTSNLSCQNSEGTIIIIINFIIKQAFLLILLIHTSISKATVTSQKPQRCPTTSNTRVNGNSPKSTTSLGVFWLSVATREISEKMAAMSFKYALSRSARLSDPRKIVSACRANSYAKK